MLQAKEELLQDYVDFANSTVDEQNSEHGKTAKAALQEYRAGNITVDEALKKAGAIRFLKELYKLESNHSSYNKHLS